MKHEPRPLEALTLGLAAAASIAGMCWLIWLGVDTLQNAGLGRPTFIIMVVFGGLFALAYDLYGKDHR